MMTQTMRTRLECRSPSMLGSASTTIVESMATIKEPTVVTASAIHLYSGGQKARRAAAGATLAGGTVAGLAAAAWAAGGAEVASIPPSPTGRVAPLRTAGLWP